MTVRFLELLQRNGYDLQLSLKAEGLSINFSNVATSSDVSPQIYAYPQSLMSGGVIQYYCHYIGCFPTGISDGQQNQRVNSDKQ